MIQEAATRWCCRMAHFVHYWTAIVLFSLCNYTPRPPIPTLYCALEPTQTPTRIPISQAARGLVPVIVSMPRRSRSGNHHSRVFTPTDPSVNSYTQPFLPDLPPSNLRLNFNKLRVFYTTRILWRWRRDEGNTYSRPTTKGSAERASIYSHPPENPSNSNFAIVFPLSTPTGLRRNEQRRK